MISTLNKFDLIEPNDAVWPRECGGHHTFVDEHFLYVIRGFAGSLNQVELWKFNIASHKWTKCILPPNFLTMKFFACHSTGNGSFTVYVYEESHWGRNSLENAVYMCRIVGENVEMKEIFFTRDKRGWFGHALVYDPARKKAFSIRKVDGYNINFDVLSIHQNESSGVWEWENNDTDTKYDDNGGYGTTAILANDNIYIFGTRSVHRDYNRIFVFNIERRICNGIDTKPDPVHGYPECRRKYSLAQWGRNLIIAGGLAATHTDVLSCVWSFNLDTHVLKRMDDLPIPVCSHSASVTADGQMFIFGGITCRGVPIATLQTLWLGPPVEAVDQRSQEVMAAPPNVTPSTTGESKARLHTTTTSEPKPEVEGTGKICSHCNKTKDRVAHCTNVNRKQEPEGAGHGVCGDCIKRRFVFGSLKIATKGNSLVCLLNKCTRIIGRDKLLAAVEKPVMVEWMLGSKVSLREASVRQADREKRKFQEEEPQLTPIDSLRFENIFDHVDEDAFVHASNLLPDVCFSWLLDNFDRGLQYLIEHQATATKRKPKRRDNTGVTHLVETRLKLQTTFQCAICFDDYRTHLAVSCVRVSDDEAAEPHEQHHFCRGCVSGYTVDVEQESIVRGGLGLKCMQPDCAGIFIYSHIEPLLQDRNRNQLQEKIAAAALAAASVNVERCLRCPYGEIIGMSHDAQPTFSCANCGFEYCRTCKTEWSESHMGKKCEQVDPKYARRMVENELSLLTVGGLHHCPMCNKPIVKNGGCKKVTCCGVKHLYREPRVITKEKCEAFVQKYIDSTDDPLVIAELKKIDCNLFSSPVPRGDARDVGAQNQMGGW